MGEIVVREKSSIPAERGADAVADRGDDLVAERRRGVALGEAGERRMLRRRCEQCVHLLEHGLDVRPRSAVTLPKAFAQVGDVLIDESGHRTPPLQRLGASFRCAKLLEPGKPGEAYLPAEELANAPKLQTADPGGAIGLERL